MDEFLSDDIPTVISPEYFKHFPQPVDNGALKTERILVDGDFLSYEPEVEDDDGAHVGVFIAENPITEDSCYFEVELIDSGFNGSISVGLCKKSQPMDIHIGFSADSVGLMDGRLFKGGHTQNRLFAKFQCDDKIGCGIKFSDSHDGKDGCTMVPVFFVRNGKEVGSTVMKLPKGGFFPAISMQSVPEEVRLFLNVAWLPEEEDTHMSIDSNDDDWYRLNDIRLNGQILEYTGKGKSIIDVGLAQAKAPLNTTTHYFEIEIVDPGENCYIAIGLTRRDYPKHRHPGWNKGSIGYHADDGKIFIGSGVGDPFGPRCYKGDKMGCGILFPRDYVCQYNSDGASGDQSPSSPAEVDDLLGLTVETSDSDEEEWWNNQFGFDVFKVKVFFTKNGRTVGARHVRIPKGGFFPTIGMLSVEEKVRVDLHPLSG